MVDVWRCPEVCAAAGCRPTDFADGELATARTLFAERSGPGMQVLGIWLSVDVADRWFIRIRALIARVLGPG